MVVERELQGQPFGLAEPMPLCPQAPSSSSGSLGAPPALLRAALLCWWLGSALWLHVREAEAHPAFWDSLMGLLGSWSFVLEPAREAQAHLWTGVGIQQDLFCEPLAGPYPWQRGGGRGGRA